MKKVDIEKALQDVAQRAWFDYKANKVLSHDDLLNVVDVYLEQAGLSSFEYGDEAVQLFMDKGFAVCDRCGALIRDEERVDIGEYGTLRAGVITMSRAGETDYLRDDIMGVEVVCRHCEHLIYEYVPKFVWGGSVYASQSELDADVVKFEKFRAGEQATLEELPRTLILDLKRKELDHKKLEEEDETASMAELMCAEYLMSDDELAERVGGTVFTVEDFTSDIPLF